MTPPNIIPVLKGFIFLLLSYQLRRRQLSMTGPSTNSGIHQASVPVAIAATLMFGQFTRMPIGLGYRYYSFPQEH